MQSNRFRTALIALGAGAALTAILEISPAASAQVAPADQVSDSLTIFLPERRSVRQDIDIRIQRDRLARQSPFAFLFF
jgi:hypothetical protein